MARQRIYGSTTPPTENDPMAFAKRLNSYLLRKGWKQADLVRAAQNHMPEGMLFGRHLISSYIRGGAGARGRE